MQWKMLDDSNQFFMKVSVDFKVADPGGESAYRFEYDSEFGWTKEASAARGRRGWSGKELSDPMDEWPGVVEKALRQGSDPLLAMLDAGFAAVIESCGEFECAAAFRKIAKRRQEEKWLAEEIERMDAVTASPPRL